MQKDTGKPYQSKHLVPPQDHRTISPSHERLHIHSCTPSDTRTTSRSLDPHETHQSKRMQYLGETSSEIRLPSLPLSSPRSYVGDTKLSPSNVRQHTYPSTLNNASGKSVRFSDPKVTINCPSYTSGCPPKSVLKCSNAKATNMPHAEAPNDDLSAEINAILYALIALVKSFKCPTRLDFLANTNDPMLLVNNEINRSFINQLCKLDGLRTKLAGIPTRGDEKLKDQHQAADMAIGRALRRMKKHQLALYEKFRELNDPHVALNNLLIDLEDFVDKFEYPSELDFSSSPENTLSSAAKNKKFIFQLRKLHWFRDELNTIPTYNDEQLKQKQRDISVAIGRSLQMLKRHQLELYKKYDKVHRTHHT